MENKVYWSGHSFVGPMQPYIVMCSAASMPSSCWGSYKRVSVVKLAPGAGVPRMISPRARGVQKIVATWEKCNVGKTARCAFECSLIAAQDMARDLNRIQADLVSEV